MSPGRGVRLSRVPHPAAPQEGHEQDKRLHRSSEARFKTLRYLHDFPKSFDTLDDAREFLTGFFNEYNHIHHHSGIGWHTPASVHYGTADAVDEQEVANIFTQALTGMKYYSEGAAVH